jgi:acetoin utilization deacetylase AcuC-like enzyme
LTAPSPTALVAHPDCGRHDTGWRHPEHQGRLPAIVNALHADTPALQDMVLQREAAHAPEVAVRRVHGADHLAHVEAFARRAAELGHPVFANADTAVSAASVDAALAAAGCALEAAALVMRGEARTAFALTRPPGHHAGPDYAMGFCLLNNVAIAARALQAEWGVERVLIVDWDVHHGNGTQETFYHDATVYYLSLHQAPWYPGTGSPFERGEDAGRNTTRNVTLPADTDATTFRLTFDAALDATLEEFAPDFILVSAGFDCMAGDPLGRLRLESRDMHALMRTILERAADTARGRVALVLEGGYAPEQLGCGVVDVFRALADLPPRA